MALSSLAPAPSGLLALVRRLVLVLGTACLLCWLLLRAANPPIVLAETDTQGMLGAAQPYELNTAAHEVTLALRLSYMPYQNAAIVIEPQGGCVTQIGYASLAPGMNLPVPALLNVPRFCHEARLDFSAQLREGLNEIFLKVSLNKDDYTANPDKTLLYVMPQLFGSHIGSTAACLGFFAACAYCLFLTLRFAGFDRAVTAMGVGAFLWFALTLHIKPNLAYSNDIPGHIAYMRYMVADWWRPYAYDGWEHFHPPLYYFLAARFYGLFEANVPGPLNAARLFALLLYTVFCFFGLRTLQMASIRRNAAYHVGCFLVLFWPLSPIMATRISNDIAVYAAWSIAFYYVARFFEKRELSALQLAVAFTGLTFAFKTSGITILMITSFSGLYALTTGRIVWRDMIRGRSLAAFACLALGILANTGKTVYLFFKGANLSDYLSPGAHEVHSAWYYLHFNLWDFLLHPVVTFEHEPSFFNYFLKTVLHSEQQLHQLVDIPRLMNLVLLILMGFTAILTVRQLRRRSQALGELLPYIEAVIIAPFEPLVFMLLKNYMFCQSFRFILPVLVPFTVLLVKGLSNLPETRGGRAVYWTGVTLAAGLAVTGLMMTFWLYAQGEFA